ncbi:hypothetical protein [Treponema denticola]|nr:hypothetical protein [Treponema denticola]
MPLLQVRECPEDIYRKITYAAKMKIELLHSKSLFYLKKPWGKLY